ncbi:hypothetical protein IAD21_01260 [Abditibacteriota bacterium]|nr:hypothetical protein IAD21_01260 [Abditibacteriota bacterium]
MLWFRKPRSAAPLVEGIFEIPILLVSYFPTRFGFIDPRVTGDVVLPLLVMRARTKSITERVILALEEGSRFHGFKKPSAQPSLRYSIEGNLEFLEPLPTFAKPGHAEPMTDYNAIMERVNIQKWLARGVKEVWIWGYHGGRVDLWESNMASKWGDISNSDRDETDLPVFDSTYTVYHYNYGRGVSEAVEDHMHQIEAVLRHVDDDLFWNKFVGEVGEGRCGWSHFPPNGERDYDWANPNWIETDLEDWHPDGGLKTRLNCTSWNGDSLAWFMLWMQCLPGYQNGIVYQGQELPNWWTWIGDFDGAMQRQTGLS